MWVHLPKLSRESLCQQKPCTWLWKIHSPFQRGETSWVFALNQPVFPLEEQREIFLPLKKIFNGNRFLILGPLSPWLGSLTSGH